MTLLEMWHKWRKDVAKSRARRPKSRLMYRTQTFSDGTTVRLRDYAAEEDEMLLSWHLWPDPPAPWPLEIILTLGTLVLVGLIMVAGAFVCSMSL